jgi:hypothetical protein
MSLSAGTTLGPYEILTPVGAGGMGEACRTRDARLEHIVAIGMILAHANLRAPQNGVGFTFLMQSLLFP